MSTKTSGFSNALAFEKDIFIDSVVPDISGHNKEAAVKDSASYIAESLNLPRNEILSILSSDDFILQSYIGSGITTPVLKLNGIETTKIFLGRFKPALSIRTPDDYPIDIMCVVAAPYNQNAFYLRKLARLSRVLKSENVANMIRSSGEPETIKNLIHNPHGWVLAA